MLNSNSKHYPSLMHSAASLRTGLEVAGICVYIAATAGTVFSSVPNLLSKLLLNRTKLLVMISIVVFILFAGCITEVGKYLNAEPKMFIMNKSNVIEHPKPINETQNPELETENKSEAKVITGIKFSSDETYEYIISDDDNDIWTMCEKPCPINKELLVAKHKGMATSINKLKKLLGTDFAEGRKPVQIHLNGDKDCGTAEDMKKQYGFITGYAATSKDGSGKGKICMFDYEKTNRILPFDIDNAERIQDQLLFVHEAVHIMFSKRAAIDYDIEEPFAKAISYYISGAWDGNDIKDENFKPVNNACDETIKQFAVLNYNLCKDFGFDFDDYAALFTKIDDEYAKTGKGVSNEKFKSFIDEIAGKDTEKAFE